MDANRTYLLAQNGVPGEHVVSHPANTRTYPSHGTKANADKTMQRRDSADSLDSLACEKEEAHSASTPRSGLRSALSKVTRRLSGAGKDKKLTGGSSHEHEPFQVYVVGSQVVYLGPGSNRRRNNKGGETRAVEGAGAEKERKMSTGHWDDGGVAHDARVMRRTS